MKNKKLINAIAVIFIFATIITGCSNKSNLRKSNTAEENKLVEVEKETTNANTSEKQTTSTGKADSAKQTTSINKTNSTKGSASTDKGMVTKDNKKKMTNSQQSAKTLHSIFGTIKSLDKNTKVIGFDDLEMITADKKERMKQIGITDKDFSNWYLYNASNEIKYYKITDKTSITIYAKDNGKEISTDINGLYNQFVSGYENHYDIKVQGDI